MIFLLNGNAEDVLQRLLNAADYMAWIILLDTADNPLFSIHRQLNF